MYRLSHRDWPARHACTYVSWTYRNTLPQDHHDHDHPELFWVEGGHGIHHCNGQARPMAAGYFVLIRPEDRHSFSALEGDSVQFINFAFRPDVWEKVRAILPAPHRGFFDAKPMGKREYVVDAIDRERLRIMATDLASGRWNQTNAAAMLHGTLALLANQKAGSSDSLDLPEWLAHALRTIQRWPHFVQGVPEFVRLAGRSHEHVTRHCRHLINTTPREVVAKARLRWAAMQLETTSKKIIVVAQECGFDNLSHFYTLFRAAHGVTPRVFRLHRRVRESESSDAT